MPSSAIQRLREAAREAADFFEEYAPVHCMDRDYKCDPDCPACGMHRRLTEALDAE